MEQRHVEFEAAPAARRLRAHVRRRFSRGLRIVTEQGPGALARMVYAGVARRTRRATPISSLALRSGRQVHRVRPGVLPTYRTYPFRMPEGCPPLRGGPIPFLVDIERIITYCGFSYVPGGWHPFSALLEEYDANPELRYEDSILARLYERFQPGSAQEAVFCTLAAPPLSPLDRLPPLHDVLKYLWRLDHHQVARLHGTTGPVLDDHGRFFGPKTRALGEHRFRRVIEVYDSVRSNGFDPARFGGKGALGYFLVRSDGDWRFVASGVNHRLAALHRLGVRRVVARFLPRHPAVVEEEHLERFSPRRGGIYDLSDAERLFDQMFTATGKQHALTLGLVDRPD